MPGNSQNNKIAFTGYIKDKLTTLKPATDRIFGTRATVKWEYAVADRIMLRSRAHRCRAAQGICRARQHERAAHAV